MRNTMKYSVLCFMMFLTSEAIAQEEVHICDNGGFESGYNHYDFQYANLIAPLPFDCNFNSSLVPSYTGMASLVNTFANPVTLVDGDTSVSGGYDPSLAAYSVYVNRVYEGEYAIKLNDEVADNSVTIMSKLFTVKEDIVTYNFSIIAEYTSLSSEQPHFIVRLYNSSNVEIAENCIQIDSSNPTFFTTSSNELLYTGWRCGELSTALAEEDETLRLEFIMMDDGKGPPVNSFATVYIDDICNIPCCPECPDMTIDVGVSDHQDAEVCIHAYNTIGGSAIADYHAGFEVVLLPGTSADPNAVPGFESLYGSDGYYHILGCDGVSEPEERRKMNIEKAETYGNNLKIYPNPTNSELNILSGNSDIRAISLMALDGKVVFVKQAEEVNTKDYRLDMSGMSQGVYILSVETKDGAVTTHKIIRE